MNHRWDVDIESDCCSENVRILFLALHGVISEIADQAFIRQGRDVTSHLVENVRPHLLFFLSLMLFFFPMIFLFF